MRETCVQKVGRAERSCKPAGSCLKSYELCPQPEARQTVGTTEAVEQSVRLDEKSESCDRSRKWHGPQCSGRSKLVKKCALQLPDPGKWGREEGKIKWRLLFMVLDSFWAHHLLSMWV